MEELKQLKKMGRKELLEYTLIILLILSGTILDCIDHFADTPMAVFLQQQARCFEFQRLGLSLLAFKFISYEHIKLKTFSFMFCVWSSVIIAYNNIFIDSNFIPLLNTLYALYLWWLIRILLIKKPEKNVNVWTVKALNKNRTPYNILLPVNSYRGLLQILFMPWKDPLYETRLLVDQKNTICILDSKFTTMEYSAEHIESIVKKDCKIVPCKKYSKEKIYSLIGKRAILGIRDCKRLEV